jgi:hypothetical protein
MLAYCDKIADTVRKSLLKHDPQGIIGLIGPIEMDLHPTQGYFQSTKKTIEMTDMNSKKYKITIEEVI